MGEVSVLGAVESMTWGDIDHNKPTALVVAPHADDESIGPGGLIATMAAHINVEVVVFGVNSGLDYTRVREFLLAMEVLGVQKSTILYPGCDGYLDRMAIRPMVTDIDRIINQSRPMEIYYCPPQHHQDHEAVEKVMRAALRPWAREHQPELVAMYELPGWYTIPTHVGGYMYVELSDTAMKKKVAAVECYRSQARTDGPASKESVYALARMRGLECGCRYAEQFRIVRIRRMSNGARRVHNY